MAYLPEYEALREKTKQRSFAQGQQAGEAIRRRFAALGNLGSGASIKAEQQATAEAQKMGEESLSQIDAAESTERQRRQEITEGRSFASLEAEKGRLFQSGESKLGREFASAESKLGRDMQQEQFEKQFAFAQSSKAQELDIARQELQVNKDIAAYNKQVSQWEMGRPTDIFAQLLGPKFSIGKLF